MLNKQFIVYSTLLLMVLSSIQYSPVNSAGIDQTPELKNNLIVYDYTIDNESITFIVSYPQEIDKFVTSISADIAAPNSDFRQILEFVKDDVSGNWTAQIVISNSTPRYIYNNVMKIYTNRDGIHEYDIYYAFKEGTIDLGRGIENQISSSVIPSIDSIQSNTTSVSIGDTLNLTISVSYPFPEFLTVSSIIDSIGSKTFLYKGYNRFEAHIKLIYSAFTEIKLSSIHIGAPQNNTWQSFVYSNGQNFTSPVISVSDGATIDLSAPLVDFQNINYNFFDHEGVTSLNLTIPITDQNEIVSTAAALGSPNSTFYLEFYPVYNATLGRYQSIIDMDPNYPAYLQLTYLSTSDSYFNKVKYSLKEESYPTTLYNFSVFQRPLGTDDKPDVTAPTFDSITYSTTELNYTADLNVTLSITPDTSGSAYAEPSWAWMLMYPVDAKYSYFNNHVYKSSNSSGLYITFSFNFYALIFENTLSLQAKITNILLSDNIGNYAYYVEGHNLNSDSITIRYPDSWYVSQPSSSSASSSISQNSGNETSPNTSIDYPILGIIPLLLISIIYKRRRR